MSRTPGAREGFGIEDGAYYLECRGNMNSLLRKEPLMVPVQVLFRRICSGTAPVKLEKYLQYLFLGPLLPLN
jgi:hypothetical protein